MNFDRIYKLISFLKLLLVLIS